MSDYVTFGIIFFPSYIIFEKNFFHPLSRTYKLRLTNKEGLFYFPSLSLLQIPPNYLPQLISDLFHHLSHLRRKRFKTCLTTTHTMAQLGMAHMLAAVPLQSNSIVPPNFHVFLIQNLLMV